MGFMRPKAPSGPSPEEIQRRQEAARQAERERIARVEAEEKATQRAENERSFAAKEEKRKAFAGKLLSAEEEAQGSGRKRFLKGA